MWIDFKNIDARGFREQLLRSSMGVNESKLELPNESFFYVSVFTNFWCKSFPLQIAAM